MSAGVRARPRQGKMQMPASVSHAAKRWQSRRFPLPCRRWPALRSIRFSHRTSTAEAIVSWLPRQAAIITGGGTGVGRATAMELAQQGCSVLINYSRSRAEAEATAGEIEEHGVKAIAVQADVADDAACRAMVDHGRQGLRPRRRAGEQRGHDQVCAGHRPGRGDRRGLAAHFRRQPDRAVSLCPGGQRADAGLAAAARSSTSPAWRRLPAKVARFLMRLRRPRSTT